MSRYRLLFGTIPAVALISCLTAMPARGLTITFDSVPSSNNPILTSLTTQGFDFTSGHFHTIDFFGTNFISANGSPVFIGEEQGSLGLAITMQVSGGGTFSLNAFDGAEFFVPPEPGGFPNATSIRVVGSLFGGGSVTAQFNLDGIVDGPGGAVDFQTFVLPGTFTNLTDVTFTGRLGGGTGGSALDNIVVNVPEPSSLLLAAFGLIGLAAWSWRRMMKQS